MTVMNNKTLSAETERAFDMLEQRLGELIDVCQQNQSERVVLLAERQGLIDQNEQSRARIDAMVLRLQGLETEPTS